MQIVNSKERLLEGPVILGMAASNDKQTTDQYSPDQYLAFIASEMTIPGTDAVQIGNTVFIGHKGKGKNKRKMVGRAFNVDTGRNFILNGFKYFTYLQKKKVTHYMTTFRTPVFLNAFKLFDRRAQQQNSDTLFSIGKVKGTDEYVVYIHLGKKPLMGPLLRNR